MEITENEAPPDLKERLKASYDQVAPRYNTWTERHSPLRLQYLEKLYEHCPKLADSCQASASIVELGCGAGVPTLSTLLSRNEQLHAIANDLSTTQMDLARQNLSSYSGRVKFCPGDMMSHEVLPPPPPGSQTAVVALYSLIHLPPEEQRTMVGRIAGWLETGGCMLANFSAQEFRGKTVDKWLDKEDWIYWSGLGRDGTVRAVEEAGLKVEICEEVGDSSETTLWVIARK